MPDQDPEISLALATSAVNSTEYTKGFSSIQWAYGRQTEFDDEELKRQIMLPEDRQQDQFARLMNNGQTAEELARKARANHAVSRLKNTTVKQPWRTFDMAQPVMVWCKFLPFSFHKGKKGGVKRTVKPRWIGPGRIVLHELIPGQHEGDRIGIVWVVLGNSLYRCSVHSVRPLSEREQAIFDTTNTEDPTKWRQLADLIPAREYIDIENEAPGEEERELPDQIFPVYLQMQNLWAFLQCALQTSEQLMTWEDQCQCLQSMTTLHRLQALHRGQDLLWMMLMKNLDVNQRRL